MAAMWSRILAAVSNSSALAAVFMRSRKSSMSSVCLPCRNSTAWSTSFAYASGVILVEHGQRLSWQSSPVRSLPVMRRVKAGSRQVRRWKLRFTSRSVCRMEEADAYGPK